MYHCMYDGTEDVTCGGKSALSFQYFCEVEESLVALAAAFHVAFLVFVPVSACKEFVSSCCL